MAQLYVFQCQFKHPPWAIFIDSSSGADDKEIETLLIEFWSFTLNSSSSRSYWTIQCLFVSV